MKDIVAINQEFHTGKLSNQSSLDYAIKTIGRSKNWLRSAAMLVRAVLIDHVFEDGNKRTSAAIIAWYCDIQNLPYDPDKLSHAVVRITKENITNIQNIERLIKDVIV